MSVQAWFSHDEVELAPGSTLSLPLTVHNLGDTTESYTIVPAGLAASWTNVTRGNVTLFGGSQDVIQVDVSPPALPTTTAGPTAIVIRIIPMGDSDDTVVAETTVSIAPFDDCRLVPLQPVQRSRRRAMYEFMVENHGNTVASCRLHLVDPTNRIDGDFDPPAVGVGPGAASLVRLKARAQRSGFRRASRTLDFEIEAARQGVAPVSTPLALVQSPSIPLGAIARTAVALGLLAGLVLAWFALIEPTIQNAVEDEVRAQEAPVTTAVAGTPDADTAGPETTAAPAGDAAGDPSFFRLEVAAPLTQAASQTMTMPDGETFDMTDVRVENPYNDRGVATLLVNDQQVFIWSLENIRGSFFEPRITPIRLEPGDNVAFSVRCDEIGDPSLSTCTSAINVGGTTTPVEP